jgi:hypothetical protein
MRDSEAENRGKGLNTLGWILALGGLALAVLTYLALGIDTFFAKFDGMLGLDESVWVLLGGAMWVLAIVSLVGPVVERVGFQSNSGRGV